MTPAVDDVLRQRQNHRETPPWTIPVSALNPGLQQRWRELRVKQDKLGDGTVTAGLIIFAWLLMGITVIAGMLLWLMGVKWVLNWMMETWSFWENWGTMTALSVALLGLGIACGAAAALWGQRAIVAEWKRQYRYRRARQRLDWNQWWWDADDAYRLATGGCLGADPDLNAYSVVRTGQGSWIHVVEHNGQVWLVDDERRLVHRADPE